MQCPQKGSQGLSQRTPQRTPPPKGVMWAAFSPNPTVPGLGTGGPTAMGAVKGAAPRETLASCIHTVNRVRAGAGQDLPTRLPPPEGGQEGPSVTTVPSNGYPLLGVPPLVRLRRLKRGRSLASCPPPDQRSTCCGKPSGFHEGKVRLLNVPFLLLPPVKLLRVSGVTTANFAQNYCATYKTTVVSRMTRVHNVQNCCATRMTHLSQMHCICRLEPPNILYKATGDLS